MIEPVSDVPLPVVVLHLIALIVLLAHVVTVKLRRFVLVRQSRQNAPRGRWFRLLQVSLGLTS
jgi:hypothetical protein